MVGSAFTSGETSSNLNQCAAALGLSAACGAFVPGAQGVVAGLAF